MRKLSAILLAALSMNVFAETQQNYGVFPHVRTTNNKMSNATTGRYLYLGNAPKAQKAEDIEITVSKMSLTNRVTVWVTQAMIDNYATELYNRWKNIYDALASDQIRFQPLINLLAIDTKGSTSNEAWLKIAGQYSSHVLATNPAIYRPTRGLNSYGDNQTEDNYEDTVTTTYFKYLFMNQISPTTALNDNSVRARMLELNNSRTLFKIHMGERFIADTTKPGYVGYLTFVYPIAATKAGPFDQPREQISTMKTEVSMEARWWSDKWKDEFAGMPFLQIDWNGVAFHGPITNYRPLDAWYLRRGYVSHGCHRMDSSDLLELRAIFPVDLKAAANKIKVTILNYFDVVDWNKDGKLEVVDVKYYNIPSAVYVTKNQSVDQAIAPYLVEAQKDAFYTKHAYAAKFYDAATDTFKNIPKYEVSGNVLKTNGTHAEVPVYRFNYIPNRIIQYVEEGVKLSTGFDDNQGSYPPKYFQKF